MRTRPLTLEMKIFASQSGTKTATAEFNSEEWPCGASSFFSFAPQAPT